jgi:hypothetical protein
MRGMINRMEQRWNVLTEAIQRNASLVENFLQKTALPFTEELADLLVENFLQKTALPFTEELASFCLLEKFKVPDVPFYTGLEDPL